MKKKINFINENVNNIKLLESESKHLRELIINANLEKKHINSIIYNYKLFLVNFFIE